MDKKTDEAKKVFREMLGGRDLANDGHPYSEPYREISVILKYVKYLEDRYCSIVSWGDEIHDDNVKLRKEIEDLKDV